MIDVVLDTNVLIAALRSNLGASHALLDTLERRSWRPVISPALLLEYEAVLKREGAQSSLSAQDIDDFLDYLCSRSSQVQIFFRWRPALPDPDDDRILELAVRARATLVTFNTKDFVGAEQFGIRVVGPKELLSMIGGRE